MKIALSIRVFAFLSVKIARYLPKSKAFHLWTVALRDVTRGIVVCAFLRSRRQFTGSFMVQQIRSLNRKTDGGRMQRVWLDQIIGSVP